MGDGGKQQSPRVSVAAEFVSALGARRVKAFVLGFALAFAACTVFLALGPPGGNANPPWLAALFNSSSQLPAAAYQAHLSSLFSHFLPNSSTSPGSSLPAGRGGSGPVPVANPTNVGRGSEETNVRNQTVNGVPVRNQTRMEVGSPGSGITGSGLPGNDHKDTSRASSQASSSNAGKNQNGTGVPASTQKETEARIRENGAKSQTQGTGVQEKNQTALRGAKASYSTAALMKRNGSTSSPSSETKSSGEKSEEWIKSLMGCDIFHGRWVRDESYPLYPEGSCPHIDEPFDCYLNGRPDRAYQKLRWQPHGCSIPRLNATDMLERLRGKRLVFVGDSLNRNMWESLVCVLRNSVKDKNKVFEASGRQEFRTEGSYSFLFKDYNCTVEFFRSPFLVQEWEMPGSNGTKKETLRLDIIEGSSSKYKDAHIIIFNTGHWWTHEKTSQGKDYYQEGSHVYGKLNVVDAFHKALNTWAKWVDNNVNPKKTLVFFRGYSSSHFSGGQWNSGGACDNEMEPIKNEAYLSSYPPKMSVLETVIKKMKVPVSYLNITRLTDYRKDAHPSIYRKQNLTDEERRSPERYQDCSHWCLPGVPDSWNELLYTQLIIKQHQLQQFAV